LLLIADDDSPDNPNHQCATSYNDGRVSKDFVDKEIPLNRNTVHPLLELRKESLKNKEPAKEPSEGQPRKTSPNDNKQKIRHYTLLFEYFD